MEREIIIPQKTVLVLTGSGLKTSQRMGGLMGAIPRKGLTAAAVDAFPLDRPISQPQQGSALNPGPLFGNSTNAAAAGNEDSMANTKSAQKAAGQTLRRTEFDQSRRSQCAPMCARWRRRMAAKDPKVAAEALERSRAEYGRGGAKGDRPQENAASRKISRLTRAHQGARRLNAPPAAHPLRANYSDG